MSDQENSTNIENEPKKPQTSENNEEKISDNNKISQNILQDILSLKEKNIYLITESFEEKIPLILSYLMEKDEEYSSENKTQILIYLKDLFNKVEFNSEIFSKKKSAKEKMNIFEIIINQYITNTSKEYLSELKNIFILLLSKVTLDRKTYKYIFSFFIDYLNKKSEFNLNSENVSKILELISLYYASIPQIKTENDYMYFNSVTNTDEYSIKIQNNKNNLYENKKNKLIFDDNSLNVLLFIKLVPKKIINVINSEHTTGLLELNFSDKSKNVSFNIDNENNLIMNNDANESIKIKELDENKYFNILFRFTLDSKELKEFKIEIFINFKKIEFKNSSFQIKEIDKAKLKELYEINSINLFRNFIGQCTNIILFKNKKNEGLPKFFTGKQVKESSMSALFEKMEKKQEISNNNILEKGLYNEDLLNILLKSELKDKVDLENIFKDKPKDNIPLTDIDEFYTKIISIYIPSRNDIVNSDIVLKDSMGGYDALFNIKNKNSNLTGLHINNLLIEDFNNMGGLNHFIPIIEIMLNDNNILTSNNLSLYFTMINTVINLYFIKLLKEKKIRIFFRIYLYFSEKYLINFSLRKLLIILLYYLVNY